MAKNVPAGYAPVAVSPSGRFIKLTGKPGDFVSGKLLSREERDDKFNPGKKQMVYFMDVEDSSLTDYTNQKGDLQEQSKIAAGDRVAVTGKPNLNRQLESVPDGSNVFISFKEVGKTKQGFQVNIFEVFMKPGAAVAGEDSPF